MQKGSIRDLSIFSYELGETIDILIYLPHNYSIQQTFSYIIAQDGKDYFQLGRIVRTLDELIMSKKMKPLLFFGIPYKDVSDRRMKYHPEGKSHRGYIRFLANELVPLISEKYSVTDLPHGRALAGDSLGATVSLLTSFQYPHTFGKLMLHSPYVDDFVLESATEFTQWNKLQIYHVIGEEESEVKLAGGKASDFLTPNKELKKIIQSSEADYFFDIFSGNHSWKYWQKDLRRALPWLFPFEKIFG